MSTRRSGTADRAATAPTPKTIVITGASDGIGAAAARHLSAEGHEVVVVGRSSVKTMQVAEPLGADSYLSDFAELASVRGLAAALLERYPVIDVLANNAGGVFGSRQRTADGFERTFQVNHLAPFLLTSLLLPTLLRSRATVIQTASVAARLYGRLDLDDLDNERHFSANRAYGDSKLENILFTRELHRRFHSDGISTAAFHPGIIGSGFAADTTSFSMRLTYANPLIRRFLGSSEDGADQLNWLAAGRPGEDWHSGEYYEKRRVATRVNRRSTDSRLALQLWDRSAELVGV